MSLHSNAIQTIEKYFKRDIESKHVDAREYLHFFIGGIYGISLYRKKTDHIIADITAFEKERGLVWHLGDKFKQFKPDWMDSALKSSWRSDLGSDYNTMPFEEWVKYIYEAANGLLPQEQPKEEQKPETAFKLKGFKIVTPERIAAEKFSFGDEDFEEALGSLLSQTSSLASNPALKDASLSLCVQQIRKLSKFQIGFYGMACASMEKEIAGMTDAATLVLNTMLQKGKK